MDSLGFKELTKVDEAVERVLSLLRPLGVEEVSLEEAVGRVLAEDVYSSVDVPPFDRATMDGYAVRAVDTFGASKLNPVTLRVVRLEEGFALGEGEAVEIATGAPLPKGSDAVLPYEDTKRVDDVIEVYKPVPKLGNVSVKGEDVRRGELIGERGRIVQAWDLGVLASIGVKKVKVVRKPKVALFSIGNELIDLDEVDEPLEDKIINSSRFVLKGLLENIGAEVSYKGILPDDPLVIYKAILNSLNNYDVVVTTGGVSIGKKDKTVEAVKRLNPELLIRGLAIRPGKPTSLCVVNGKLIVMLSGYPVASSVGFEALLKPVLGRLMGMKPLPIPKVRGILTRKLVAPVNVRSYVRVRVFRRGKEIFIEPLAVTGSGILSTLTRGNGILVVPEDVEGYDEGKEVDVVLLRGIEEVE